jgi:ABC-type sugar transport system permease subunit
VGATTTLSINVYKKIFFQWDLGAAGAVGGVWMILIGLFVWGYLNVLRSGAETPPKGG